MKQLIDLLARGRVMLSRPQLAMDVSYYQQRAVNMAITVPIMLAMGIAAASPVITVPPASSAPASADSDTGGLVTIPAGTKVDVTLIQDASQPESDIMFRVAHDVYSSAHDLLIPEGTTAYGRCFDVKPSPGQSGGFDICCSYILTANGARLPVRSEHETANGWTKTTVDFLPEGSEVLAKSGVMFTVDVDKDMQINKPLAYQTKNGHEGLEPESALGYRTDESGANTLVLPRQMPPQTLTIQPAVSFPAGLDPANTNTAAWRAWGQQHFRTPTAPSK